ncbi:hypothetical protein E2C01_072825 [Portunus trituberculatus]|uniref:Uncharacterized protein n=1 Tax=Portunus trituberculatus TaxID=210409 RepID=A0A5B7HZ35_PORTR|nr:hypothetical protein [Portunus trituberculatus]
MQGGARAGSPLVGSHRYTPHHHHQLPQLPPLLPLPPQSCLINNNLPSYPQFRNQTIAVTVITITITIIAWITNRTPASLQKIRHIITIIDTVPHHIIPQPLHQQH